MQVSQCSLMVMCLNRDQLKKEKAVQCVNSLDRVSSEYSGQVILYFCCSFITERFPTFLGVVFRFVRLIWTPA